MGLEITVDNLEDMCRLMCDNMIPTKGERMKREINNADFGKWMKEKRKERYINQSALADELNCHTSSVGRWERGEDYPKLDVAEKIVKALGAELIIRELEDERID